MSFAPQATPWAGDWMWGLPLTVLTVLIHVSGLGILRRVAFAAVERPAAHHHHRTTFFLIVTFATLSATVLHAIDAIVWALAYRLFGALPDIRSAMLFSLEAITTYGHTNLNLQSHWLLLGSIEALNGCLLLGLTTAVLISVIHKLRTPDAR